MAAPAKLLHRIEALEREMMPLSMGERILFVCACYLDGEITGYLFKDGRVVDRLPSESEDVLYMRAKAMTTKKLDSVSQIRNGLTYGREVVQPDRASTAGAEAL